jgi:hypothetical protein
VLFSFQGVSDLIIETCDSFHLATVEEGDGIISFYFSDDLMSELSKYFPKRKKLLKELDAMIEAIASIELPTILVYYQVELLILVCGRHSEEGKSVFFHLYQFPNVLEKEAA